MLSIYTIQDGCRAARGVIYITAGYIIDQLFGLLYTFFILMEAGERSWMLRAYWSPVTCTSASNSFYVIELFQPGPCYVPVCLSVSLSLSLSLSHSLS